MASKSIGNLYATVTANAVQFVSEFNRVDRVAMRVSTSVGRSVNSLLGAFGVAGGFAGAVAFGKSVIELGSQISDLASVAQMGTQQLQTLGAVGMESGFGIEDVAKASEMLRKNIQEAAAGSKEANAALRALNLTAEGLQALAPERQWEIIAARIATATNKQEALNAAANLFGAKNGPRLRQVLDELATQGFDKLTDSTAKLRISDDAIASLDRAGDSLERLWLRVKVIAAPEIAQAATALEMLLSPDKFTRNVAWMGAIAAATNGAFIPNLDLGPVAEKTAGAVKEGLAMGAKEGAKSVADAIAASELSMKVGEAQRRQMDRRLLNADVLPADWEEQQARSRALGMQAAQELQNAALEAAAKGRKPRDPVSDNLTRVGLLTGDPVKSGQDESKKQTGLLAEIRNLLRQATRPQGASAVLIH